MGDQVLAQRVGAGSQDHVVDRGAEGVLDHLEVVEGGPPEGHRAVRGHLAREAGAGGGQGQGGVHLVGAQGAHHVEGRLAGAVHGLDHSGRAGGRAQQGLAHQLEVRRHGLAPPRLVGLGHRPGEGVEVEQVDQQVGAGYPVDRGVVHLGDQRHLVVLEPLDHGELPQGPASIEGDAGDVAHDLGQLVERARLGGGDAQDVAVEVEGLVLDPHGVVQAEGHEDRTAPEGRQQVQPLEVELADALEGVAPRHRIGVDEDDADDVHVGGGRLQVEERGIHAAQALHPVIIARPLGWRRWAAPPDLGPARRAWSAPGPAPRPGRWARCGDERVERPAGRPAPVPTWRLTGNVAVDELVLGRHGRLPAPTRPRPAGPGRRRRGRRPPSCPVPGVGRRAHHLPPTTARPRRRRRGRAAGPLAARPLRAGQLRQRLRPAPRRARGRPMGRGGHRPAGPGGGAAPPPAPALGGVPARLRHGHPPGRLPGLPRGPPAPGAGPERGPARAAPARSPAGVPTRPRCCPTTWPCPSTPWPRPCGTCAGSSAGSARAPTPPSPSTACRWGPSPPPWWPGSRRSTASWPACRPSTSRPCSPSTRPGRWAGPPAPPACWARPPTVAFRVVSPLALDPQVPVEGRTIYAGLGDRFVPTRQAVSLWEHWDHPVLRWYPGGHVGFIWSKPVNELLGDRLPSGATRGVVGGAGHEGVGVRDPI